VHDAVLFEEAGAPAAVVVTEPFVDLARRTAANLGHPALAVVVVDHPLYVRDDAWIEATSSAVASTVARSLLGRLDDG
jgi:hypothetical protein